MHSWWQNGTRKNTYHGKENLKTSTHKCAIYETIIVTHKPMSHMGLSQEKLADKDWFNSGFDMDSFQAFSA